MSGTFTARGPGSFSAAVVNGDVQVTYMGAQPRPMPAGSPPPVVAMPLAVPHRRVESERLRGRDRLVDDVTAAVTRRAAGDADVPGVWLLSGMGGCGKTTVALEAAHQLRDSLMSHVWWVPEAKAETLFATLRAVAFAAGATPSDFVEGAHPADVLWKRLDALTVPWLLVLDNIDDPAVLAAESARTADENGWLRRPEHPWGTVLITSREPTPERWGEDWVHVVSVDPLSSEDGAMVLRDLAPGAGSVGEARELAEHLGGLPLALGLAGSYLGRPRRRRSASMPKSFADYRRSFDAQMAELASDTDIDLSPAERARRALLSTWELSLDLLHRQGMEQARPLLRLLSALDPAPIPDQDILDVDLLARSELFNGLTEKALDESLEGLARLKLIDIEPEYEVGEDRQSWITIHPMVRAASRTHLAAQALPMLVLVTALLERVTGPLKGGVPMHWPRWQAVAPHGPAARLLLSEWDGDVPLTADLVTAATEPAVRTARYYRDVGRYGESIAELRTVEELRARFVGAEARATAVVRLDLAWALRDNGDLAESDDIYRDLVVGQRRLPTGDRLLQSARLGRARTLLELGRYREAEEELRIAQALRLSEPNAGPRGILQIRADLARLARRQGRFEEAVTELRDVRRLTEALGPEADIDAFAARLGLVRGLRDAGHAEEAETAAEELVNEYRDAWGHDHPDVLIARHERARIMRDHEGDRALLEQARDEFTAIWESSERRLGVDHPDTIAARHELATVWHLLGRRDHAVEHFRAAHEAGRRRLGDNHPNVVVCARNLAMVLAELANETGPLPTALPVGDVKQGRAPLSSATLDLTGLSVERALSPPYGRDVRSAALARAVDRFVRSDRTVAGFGGAGDGAGFSSWTHQTNSSTGNSYRPADPVAPAALAGSSGRARAVDGAAVRVLATGAEDRRLVESLRSQERGIRLIALRDLLDLTETAMSSRSDRYPSVAQVRELLVRADRTDPQAVTTVLLAPAVGRWMSRTLRTLHTLADEPSGPLPDDLLYLHSVAAVAAFAARVPFALRLPVCDGFVILPTLGAFDLRPTKARVVVGRMGKSRRLTITFGGGKGVGIWSSYVPLPFWRPVSRIRTGHEAGARGFDFFVDDMDPHRETVGPAAPSPLGSSETNNWAVVFRAARSLLDRVDPRRGDVIAAALTAVTPRPAAPGGVVDSASSSDAFGGIVASAPPDSVELAACLVHEFQHMKLHAVLNSVALYDEKDEPDGELFYAPWRDDPRPLPGLLQGVFAFFGVVDFWRKLTRIEGGAGLRRAQFQLVYWRTQAQDAYTALCLSPRLTEAGQYFAALMGGTTVTWTDHEDVPEDIVSLAMEAVVAHRARWRLRHMRPGIATVAEVADAWASGASRPPWRTVAVTLRPDLGVEPSNAYTALLCKAATAAYELRAVPVASGFLEVSGAQVDPADLARLQGSSEEARRLAAGQVERWPQRHEPWVRLGLALRRSAETSTKRPAAPGTASAAGALTHCPEVVRAVHMRVTEVTGTPPDPVALAAWIGVPDVLDGHAGPPRPPADGRRRP
ncbi:aKG-HExxH-type peptide beta-hydroxylase [Streptomyces sp. NPDC049627]|uniref:aKG-HExxH-type peptide beta-hydroxylase n=1 Tax=Streptomyces sp. NPDC049627 TaxID=3365595 RepID=UPI00379E9BA8